MAFVHECCVAPRDRERGADPIHDAALHHGAKLLDHVYVTRMGRDLPNSTEQDVVQLPSVVCRLHHEERRDGVLRSRRSHRAMPGRSLMIRNTFRIQSRLMQPHRSTPTLVKGREILRLALILGKTGWAQVLEVWELGLCNFRDLKPARVGQAMHRSLLQRVPKLNHSVPVPVTIVDSRQRTC